MEHTKRSVIGALGAEIVYEQWLPSTSAQAVVVLLHGYSEHRGRYEHVIGALLEAGYAVYALDHRGHGESGGARANVERFDYFVNDLDQVVSCVRTEQPELPIFMLAHSMGGLIATHYVLCYPHMLAGLILSSPALHIGENVSPRLLRMSRVLARVLPYVRVTRQATEPLLSRDPAVDQRFVADRLCYQGQMKARMGYQLLTASHSLRNQVRSITLPLLIMQGTMDKVVNPAGAQWLFDQVTSSDKTLRWWPGCLHELFNDLPQAEVIACVLEWLAAHRQPQAMAPLPLEGVLTGAR